MKTFILAFCILALLGSCSSKTGFRRDKAAFDSARVIMRFKSIGDMNDSYFEIKENNFFEFYKLLYDSVKNSRYPGRYSKDGDTLMLEFYNRKGYDMLGRKALVDKNKKEVVFFDSFPGYRKRLLVN